MIADLKPYPEYKESGLAWLGQVPRHWEVLPLRGLLAERKERNDPVKTTNILSLSLQAGVTLYADKKPGAFVDAAHLVASFAFASTGVRRLEARIDAGNARAKAALRKLGGIEEGILRRAARRGGDDVDQALWAVLKETWQRAPLSAPVVIH